MIYSETVTINGKQYKRTYSDLYYIERDGAAYAEAIDPLDTGRSYTESSEKLPAEQLAERYIQSIEQAVKGGNADV